MLLNTDDVFYRLYNNIKIWIMHILSLRPESLLFCLTLDVTIMPLNMCHLYSPWYYIVYYRSKGVVCVMNVSWESISFSFVLVFPRQEKTS